MWIGPNHSCIWDWFDFQDNGTVLSVRIFAEPWKADEDAWKTAGTVIIRGETYILMSWDFTTHNFENCLTGEPTIDATFQVLIKGHYPKDHFAVGDVVRVQ